MISDKLTNEAVEYFSKNVGVLGMKEIAETIVGKFKRAATRKSRKKDIRPHIEGGAWAKKEAPKEGSLAWAIAQAKAGKSIRRKGVGDKTWRMRKTENGWKRKVGNEPWEACGCPEAINAKDQTWEVYSEPAEKCAHCGQVLPKKSLEEKVFCMMRESRSKGETLVREIIATVREEIAKEGKAK